MTTLKLGYGAYKRTVDGSPEVKLVNRYIEADPTNLIEQASLLARPGTKFLAGFPPDKAGASFRGMFSRRGSFNSDLFVVSGRKLYRYSDDKGVTQLGGELADNGYVRATFVKGAGYERVFFTDGLNISYYEGSTRATGVMSVISGEDMSSLDHISLKINDTYYAWTTGSFNTNADGSQNDPYECKIETTSTGDERIRSMVDMINYDGERGVDFSDSLTASNALVKATSSRLTHGGVPDDILSILFESKKDALDAGDIYIHVVDKPGYKMYTDQTHLGGGSDASGGNPAVAAHAQVLHGLAGYPPHYYWYRIRIANTYYTWSPAADIDAGNGVVGPNGTEDAPWRVAVGATTNPDTAMRDAINGAGVAGTDYSTNLTAPSSTVVASLDMHGLTLTAKTAGAAGNLITLSVDPHFSEYAPFLQCTPYPLAGGGYDALKGVTMPDGQAVVACASLNQYVFVAVADSQRFYFIKPGEVTINALDFASKESNPDPILDMKRVGDELVIMGSASTEFWSATGNKDAPFSPVVGRTLSRGIVDGTAVVIDEQTLMYVGDDYRVYTISGRPRVVSGNSMDERIRLSQRGA